MKDGYYLSAYIHIDQLANVADLHIRHDQNISLWLKHGNKVSLIHYWELERLSGIKHHWKSFWDRDTAIAFINQLLEEYNLSYDTLVEVWGTPDIAFSHDYHSLVDNPEYPYHNISHLFAALLVDTELFYKENILALAVDGAPDFVLEATPPKHWFSGAFSRQGEITNIFPVDSPGPLWMHAAVKFGMEEGSLMALGTASTSRLPSSPISIDDLVLRNYGAIRRAGRIIDLLIRQSEMFLSQKATVPVDIDARFSERENLISMVMKEVQLLSMHIMERTVQKAIDQYKINPENTYYACSGGFALNCPTNSHLMQQFGFKGFLTTPAVNDGGQSLGIALYAFHKKMKGRRFEFAFPGPYVGDSDDSIQEILNDNTYQNFVLSALPLDLTRVVEDIVSGPVLWFDGHSELGPRALGHRSILGDPRTIATRDMLNNIKQRQWWRPVAPIVLLEDAPEWFERVYASPFMLQTFRIHPDKEELIPAVAHLDASSRIQTISAENDKQLHRILCLFKQATGVPILCNTSLNDRGEPIVNTIREALNFALRKRIPIAYINNIRVHLHNHDLYEPDVPLARTSQPFESIGDRDGHFRRLNPFDLSHEELWLFWNSPTLRVRFSLTNKHDVDYIRRILKPVLMMYGLE